MIKNKKNGFTLIELIVVITILAILGTIAFISLQGYSANARDSRRISDIANIRKSLELFTIKTGKYPLPDNGFEVLYDDELARTQGTVGDKVTTNLSRNLNKKPLDPLTELEYTYSVINSQTQYEVLAIYESDIISQNNLFNRTLAANLNNPKISGNYNQVYVKTTNYYVPTPTIINAELNGSGGTLDDENIISQIITNGPNNIENGTNEAQIDGLDGLTVEAFSGELDRNIGEDDNGNKVGLVGALIEAYSGSILENDGIYKTIVETTGTGDMIGLVDDLVLNKIVYSGNVSGGDSGESGGGVVFFATSTYPGCDTNDLIVGDYTISACNVGSNIAGTGSGSYGKHFQYGRNCSTEDGCYTQGDFSPDYYGDWKAPGGTNNGSALFWGANNFSSTYINSTSTNQAKMKGPCEDGYHIPTYIEWESVLITGGWDEGEKYLQFQSDLFVPPAGYVDFNRSTGHGWSLHGEGVGIYYWTSIPSGDKSIFIRKRDEYIALRSLDRLYGHSIRCFKN